MSLASAEKHLTRRHADCWSCELEKHMVQMIRRDIGTLQFRLPRASASP
jgi:hypothetical protein